MKTKETGILKKYCAATVVQCSQQGNMEISDRTLQTKNKKTKAKFPYEIKI